MNPVLVRQRPAIGDAVMLSPTIKALAARHNSKVDIVTDPTYAAGGLVSIFNMIPEVNKVIPIEPAEWTTWSNAQVDPRYAAYTEGVPFPLRNRPLYDANGAFISYEREHRGNPPLGIAEFWFKYFGFGGEMPPMSLEPSASDRADAKTWAATLPQGKVRVGIVLRAGDPVRDWDRHELALTFADFLHTSGHTVVTIDPIKSLGNYPAIVGKPLNAVVARVETLDVVITPDTGMLHIAEALKVPTIAIWGIMPPALRVKGYNTTLTPHLGCCTPQDTYCRCWKFQRYSCLQRLRLTHLVNTFEQWYNFQQGTCKNGTHQ
jgi:ADP-heptose:LPS heptosyltransferase